MGIQAPTGKRRPRQASFSQYMSQTILYAVMSLGAFLFLIPFVWMVSTALKEAGDVMKFPPEWIPQPVLWGNFKEAFTQDYAPFDIFFKNTIIITVTAVFGQLLSASLVGFSFARLRWWGRDYLFLIVLGTMMLPYQVTLGAHFRVDEGAGLDRYASASDRSLFLGRRSVLYIPLPAIHDDYSAGTG